VPPPFPVDAIADHARRPRFEHAPTCGRGESSHARRDDVASLRRERERHPEQRSNGQEIGGSATPERGDLPCVGRRSHGACGGAALENLFDHETLEPLPTEENQVDIEVAVRLPTNRALRAARGIALKHRQSLPRDPGKLRVPLEHLLEPRTRVDDAKLAEGFRESPGERQLWDRVPGSEERRRNLARPVRFIEPPEHMHRGALHPSIRAF